MFITFFHFYFTDNSVWQQQLYGGTVNFRNISEPSPTFGKVPNSVEVMPGQTVVLSCIVNNLGDRTVKKIPATFIWYLTWRWTWNSFEKIFSRIFLKNIFGKIHENSKKFTKMSSRKYVLVTSPIPSQLVRFTNIFSDVKSYN